MMKFRLAIFGLAAAAGLTAVAAVSLPRAELPTCANAVNTVLTAPDPNLNCIRPLALSSLIRQGTTNNALASVTNSINLWLTQFCSVGFCPLDTLEKSATTISTGCGSNFGSFDLPAGGATPLIDALKTSYPVVRDMMCLKNVNNGNKFCMTELLSQANVTALNFADPAAIVEALILRAFNTDCNECTRAAFQLASKISNFESGTIGGICGTTFAAGLTTSAPLGIVQTAPNVQFGAAPASPGAAGPAPSNGGGALAPTAAFLLLATSAFFTLV
ncbi:hypothetical protein FB451DRAFT_1403904 [Mycena latifolia]|nr:hypothetical protein FB451DRAFT_1403904 [Mycena latifolia]